MQLQTSGLIRVCALLSLLFVPCLGSALHIVSHRHVTRSSNAALHDETFHAPNATVNQGTFHDFNTTNSTGARPVYLVMYTRLTGAQIFPPTYDKLFPVYASLHFNATTTDGPLDVQLVNKNGQDLIRVTDWGLQNSDKPMGVPQPGYLIDYFQLFGESNVTNNQILSSSTGEGLIYDVWANRTSLALKAYNSNDFMLACIGHLGLGIASSDSTSAIIPTRWRYAQIYWRNIWTSERVVNQYPVWLERLHGWGDNVQKTRAVFQYKTGTDPSVTPFRPAPLDPFNGSTALSLTDNGMSDLAAPGLTETYQASKNLTATAPQFQWIYAQPPSQPALHRRADPPALVPKQFIIYNPGDDIAIGVQLEEGGEAAMKPATVTDVIAPADRATNVVTARAGGLTTLGMFRLGARLASLLGELCVVVLDFTNKDDGTSLIVGIVSLTTTALGIMIASAYAFPLLAEITILAATIVATIPDMTHSVQNYAAQQAPSDWDRRSLSSISTPPLRTSVQEILQWTITGDRNKTGNEPCLAKGAKECTVVYGPYLLATALQIENFDAFVILIHFNQGYPMALKDLVKAFRLSTDSDSASQVATIDCSHSSKPDNRYSWSSPNRNTIMQQCDKPKFSVKRQLANIPIVNETADKLYSRLMPQGNCSLVGDTSGGERYPAYNMTIKGGAVAIACGIVGAINVNGTATPLPGASLSANMSHSLSLVSPGNDSSDGSSGHAYIAPPPKSSFKKTLNLTNSICMTAPGGSNLCFPNGTYSAQSGSLGFDSTKADTLILSAPGSSVVVPVSKMAKSKGVYAHAQAPPPTYVDQPIVFSTNQSATANPAFAADMRDMAKYHQGNTFTVHCPTPPDAVCLYTQPYGRGDVACFGPGGGDLPQGLKGKARSVKAFGRASVEVFAYSYGNSFGKIFDTYEDDLASLPYNTSHTFADVAMSIWVYLEGSMGS